MAVSPEAVALAVHCLGPTDNDSASTLHFMGKSQSCDCQDCVVKSDLVYGVDPNIVTHKTRRGEGIHSLLVFPTHSSRIFTGLQQAMNQYCIVFTLLYISGTIPTFKPPTHPVAPFLPICFKQFFFLFRLPERYQNAAISLWPQKVLTLVVPWIDHGWANITNMFHLLNLNNKINQIYYMN